MRFYILILLPLTALLAACGTPHTEARFYPTAPSVGQNATVALAEAANSVNRSLIQLNATEQAANPPQNIAEPPAPSTYGMDIPASLEWNGPVEKAVAELAKAASYNFKIIGNPPSMPILVYVSQQNSNVGDILRNIGLQCKNQASIVVYPKNKLIELRYIG